MSICPTLFVLSSAVSSVMFSVFPQTHTRLSTKINPSIPEPRTNALTLCLIQHEICAYAKIFLSVHRDSHKIMTFSSGAVFSYENFTLKSSRTRANKHRDAQSPLFAEDLLFSRNAVTCRTKTTMSQKSCHNRCHPIVMLLLLCRCWWILLTYEFAHSEQTDKPS